LKVVDIYIIVKINKVILAFVQYQHFGALIT
jgi:hypothetical protein